MAEPTLKPETLADLKQAIMAEKGIFGALKLKSEVEKCPCALCSLVREFEQNEKA
jgi:hypothetical protein